MAIVTKILCTTISFDIIDLMYRPKCQYEKELINLSYMWYIFFLYLQLCFLVVFLLHLHLASNTSKDMYCRYSELNLFLVYNYLIVFPWIRISNIGLQLHLNISIEIGSWVSLFIVGFCGSILLLLSIG